MSQKNTSRSPNTIIVRTVNSLTALIVWTFLILVAPAAIFSQDAETTGDQPSTNAASSNSKVELKTPGEDGPTGQNVQEGEQTEHLGIPTTALEIIEEMQFWIIPFLLASVIAVWFGIERLVVLRRNRVIPKPFVERFLQHLDQGKLDAQTALKLCEQSESPIASVFAHGVRKWGKPSVEVEQAIIDGGERQISQLRKHLRVLNGVATVMPLVGLLGTVWGMIEAFNRIADTGAMGKADQLAGGIAFALLTTAFGLAIAIPSLIVYMYLAGRVDALVMEMDHLSQDVVQMISAEALAGTGPKPKSARVNPASRPRGTSKEAG